MNSLFNSGPNPDADEPLRSTAASAAAQDDAEEGMLFSSVRRGGGASMSSSSSVSSGDKEITLGTMTVLAIFFALAVLCAGFFAFGYSAGSKHSGKPGPGGAPITDTASIPGCKPAPGSPMGALASAGAGNASPVNVPYTPPANVPTRTIPVSSAAPAAAMAETPAVTTAAAPAPAASEHLATRTPVAPPVPAAVAPAVAVEQGTMVQVAALSHQADAELVASTLKGRGYAVSIRSSATDKLLHVQLGPYATRKEADAMRQKLLNDGFNAILK